MQLGFHHPVPRAVGCGGGVGTSNIVCGFTVALKVTSRKTIHTKPILLQNGCDIVMVHCSEFGTCVHSGQTTQRLREESFAAAQDVTLPGGVGFVPWGDTPCFLDGADNTSDA